MDYFIDEKDGHLYFNYPIQTYQPIYIHYDYIESSPVTQNITNSPLSIGVGYFSEVSKEDSTSSVEVSGESPTKLTALTVQVLQNPIDQDKPVSILRNGVLEDPANYSVDYYTGVINQSYYDRVFFFMML